MRNTRKWKVLLFLVVIVGLLSVWQMADVAYAITETSVIENAYARIGDGGAEIVFSFLGRPRFHGKIMVVPAWYLLSHMRVALTSTEATKGTRLQVEYYDLYHGSEVKGLIVPNNHEFEKWSTGLKKLIDDTATFLSNNVDFTIRNSEKNTARPTPQNTPCEK